MASQRRVGKIRPIKLENLTVMDIEDMPQGQAIETPLHPKRRRVWQPDDQGPPVLVEYLTPSTSSKLPVPYEASSPDVDDQGPPVLVEYLTPSKSSKVPVPYEASSPDVNGQDAPVLIAYPTTPSKSSTVSYLVPSPDVDDKGRFTELTVYLTPPSSSSKVRQKYTASSPTDVKIERPTELTEYLTPDSTSSKMAQKLSASSPTSRNSKSSTKTTPTSSDLPSQRRRRPRPQRRLVYDNIGSESSSGESDDGDETAAPFLPRSFKWFLDMSTDDEGEPTADVSVASTAAEPAPVPTAKSTVQRTSGPVNITKTEQPWSFFDFKWEAFPVPPIPPQSRRERFSQSKVGPVTPCVDPYDIFTAVWDRHIMEHIVAETNKYAQQVISLLQDNNQLNPKSRMSRWKDTSVDEMYVYFSILIASGILVKTKMEEYWGSTADLIYTPGFGAHMSYMRYMLLSKCLHFNDNKDMSGFKMDTSDAKIFKIQPLLTHLNMKFESMYNLSQNISLDESLLMWKGVLGIKQSIPNKAASVGIKTYEICESQTGYLWRFEIHSHKKSPPQPSTDPQNDFTSAIVLRLLHSLENKGHTVWMDSFYNSPSLARRLKTLGFDCVGTLRTNRKFVPRALDSLTKDKMQPGQFTGLTSGDVDIMVWRDNSRVALISTYHGNAVSSDKNSIKPILVTDYNIMMGGVDKKDQMLAMYPVERKRTKIWYKKLFRRLLNVSILNSYIIHKKSSSSALTHRNFRIHLIRALISKHSREKEQCNVNVKYYPVNTKVDVTHRISQYPFKGSERIRRKCSVCKKRANTFCVGCDKTVCIEPCFLQLHS